MKLEEINKVEQTYSTDMVNELLAKGYIIIKIFSTKIKSEEHDEVKPVFVLGLRREQYLF